MAEIENAAEKLPLSDKLRLLDSLGKSVAREQALRSHGTGNKAPAHSILEIPVATVGAVLNPAFDRSELLDEMMKERF